MSQENVEIVRRAWGAALQNPPDWDTLERLVHPGHELINLIRSVDGWRDAPGVEGWRQLRERMSQTGDWELDTDQILPAPDDCVVVTCTVRLRAHESGAELSAARGIVQTIADGMLIRTEGFTTPEAALEAAQLSE